MSVILHESRFLFRVRMQRGVVQHKAFQASRARVDRLQEGPTIPLLLEVVDGSGERLEDKQPDVCIQPLIIHTWCVSPQPT